MKLGIMQPYFLPYLGYWQLMNAVDTYIIYDDVTYIKGGWINRNNFLVQGKAKLFTFSLENAGSYKLINEIAIKDDFSNFRKLLQFNYAKAPFYKECCELAEKIISYDKGNLGKFLYNSIQVVADYLDFKTKILLSSEIEKDNQLKGKDKVIHICKLFGATEYYNAIGGQGLYDKKEFADNGIKLSFLKTNITPYKQLKNEFVPGLSIMDILMFNPKETVKEMLNDFELV
ncbi:MAG: WbqC family protein [Treponema sp.]|nr:WbqC family protein [Treponema sp.]